MTMNSTLCNEQYATSFLMGMGGGNYLFYLILWDLAIIPSCV